jgi:hypothetical protein
VRIRTPSGRVRPILTALPLALLVVAATACGASGDSGSGSGGGAAPPPPDKKLFAEDFKPVCEGAPVSAAKPYDKAATGHKVVYMKTYKDSGLLDSSTELPADWTVKFDANGNAFAEVDLVVCAKRTAEKLAKRCDGYKVDDKPNALVVKMHTAKYTVTAHEATTGKELGRTTVAANDGSCPQSVFGIEQGTTEMNEYDSPPSENIVAFAKKFIQQ